MAAALGIGQLAWTAASGGHTRGGKAKGGPADASPKHDGGIWQATEHRVREGLPKLRNILKGQE